jgi:CBS domain-containing protein
MGFVILWLLSLASFWASFALRSLWLKKHKPEERGRFSFEIIAGLSLLLAGASSYKALEPFSPRWLNFILVILINGFLALLLPALGDEASLYLRPLGGLADFLALLLAPMAALYEKAMEKGNEAIYVVEGEEREIVEGALDLGETIVREIMVPRVDVVAIRADSTVSEAVKVATESGHSRLPAYEGSIDNITGHSPRKGPAPESVGRPVG